MSKKFLVALEGCERLEGIVPTLEKRVTPGTTIIFVFRYPLSFGSYLQDHWVTTESARIAVAAGKEIDRRYSWESQKAQAEKIIAPARQLLKNKNVTVKVKLYSGGRGALIRHHRADQDGEWVLVKAPAVSIGPLLAKARIVFSWSKCFSRSRACRNTAMRRELSIADPVIPFGMGNRRTLLELTHDLRNYLTILQLRIDDFESEIPGIVSSNKGRVTEIMQKLELLLQELTDVTASRREQH